MSEAAAEFTAENPFALFGDWFAEATKSEINDPNGMALATVDPDGMPSCRMVLLKDWDERGFVFYTNLESRKGRALETHPRAGLLFHWKSLRRQVRIQGPVEPVNETEADAYFQSRPRASRIGAWASQQSRPLESRFALEKKVAQLTAQYGLGEIPRPEYWSGFRVLPVHIEFWKDGAFRLHDRLTFTRDDPRGADGWRTARLYP